MRLVLHIGLPKAGSSAVQHSLERRASELSGLGVHYAVAAGARNASISSGNGLELARYLDPRRRPPGFSVSDFERSFEKSYLSPAHPVSVISSEFLAYADEDMLRRFRDVLLGRRQIQVIGFIRDLYGHARSSWMQLVKRGAYTRSFEQFVDELYQNSQFRVLRVFNKVFGWERMAFLHYETHAGDIFGAFLDAIGAPRVAAEPAPLINRSLSQAELDVQLRWNRLHRNKALATAMSDHFLQRNPDRAGAALWRPQVAQVLEDRFGDEVRYINDKYFRAPQQLAIARNEPRSFAEPAEAHPPESYPQVMADAAAAVCRHLGRRLVRHGDASAGADRDAP